MSKLLVLDTSFTFEAITQRKLEHSITCRDLEGFFTHVWTVHPFATLLTSPGWSDKYGRPDYFTVDSRNTFIEGKFGRFGWLSRVAALNFVLSQAALFIHLWRMIRREQIDVIRVGDPHFLGLMGWALARMTGAKVAIRVCANYDVNRKCSGQPIHPRLFRSQRLEKLVERFLFKRFDLIAGANQDNLDYALANCAPPERSTLFRYGNLIDQAHLTALDQRPDATETLAQLGATSGSFLISVARLESGNGVKRPFDVIRTLMACRAAGHDVVAVLVGDGPLRPSLEEFARSEGVADYVRFTGNRDQKWLATVLPHAAVFVSPHAGRALTEAAFSRTPAVGYDIDWQREMLIDGVTGYIVPFDAHEALARGAVQMLDDPEKARRMAEALFERAREMLDPARLNEHERAVYRELLSRNGFRATPPGPCGARLSRVK